MDPELESFKQFDLRQYAASQGYAIDKRDSCRGNAVMRHKNGDKIIVSRKSDGHFTYWSVRDDRDHGTIIDFIGRRAGLSLGAIRKELRAWSGLPSNGFASVARELTVIKKDRAAVQAQFSAMKAVTHHHYLEQERGIPALALQYWRFDGRIRIDGRRNAVFPHFDAGGLCGYELKNHNFTGFAPGGTKGLWLSKASQSDERLIVAESAIDALSYAVLFPDGYAQYASIGGKPSSAQVELLRMKIACMPARSEIVAAMDNDAAGRQLADMVRGSCGASLVQKLAFRQHDPIVHKDWNDELLASQRPEIIRMRSPMPEPTA
jgi:Toprim-like/Protein of unknown function (DUF3991)